MNRSQLNARFTIMSLLLWSNVIASEQTQNKTHAAAKLNIYELGWCETKDKSQATKQGDVASRRADSKAETGYKHDKRSSADRGKNCRFLGVGVKGEHL